MNFYTHNDTQLHAVGNVAEDFAITMEIAKTYIFCNKVVNMTINIAKHSKKARPTRRDEHSSTYPHSVLLLLF